MKSFVVILSIAIRIGWGKCLGYKNIPHKYWNKDNMGIKKALIWSHVQATRILRGDQNQHF